MGPWVACSAGGGRWLRVLQSGRAGPPLPRAAHEAREQPAPCQALDHVLQVRRGTTPLFRCYTSWCRQRRWCLHQPILANPCCQNPS